MDVLDKNHISYIKKKMSLLHPKQIAIIIEGLTPYLTTAQEGLMHENMKEFLELTPLTLYIHYYVGQKTVAEETKNIGQNILPEEKSELLTNLASIHKTSAKNTDEIKAMLEKEYSNVQLITTNNDNPHKIFQCEVGR